MIKKSFLKLLYANGFGEKSIKVLLNNLRIHNLRVDDIFGFSPHEYQHYFPELGCGKLKHATLENLNSVDDGIIDSVYEKLMKMDAKLLSIGGDNYPALLSERLKQNTPSFIFLKGREDLLNKKNFAIIGARAANDKCLELAFNIAGKLALQGFNIISGLAKGIDSYSHMGALDNGGTTTMVLSCGIFDFPKKKPFELIDWDKNALVISQFEPSEKWRATNAMTRNKLVVGLSDGVLVVETGKERDETGKMSGTFDAAKSAISMGVPVFVVSPKSECFSGKCPKGNQDLIDLGGIETFSFKELLKLDKKTQNTQTELFT